ncbi:MAG: DNA helicase-2/ATP-dependent DNA helicase PcrA [Acidimicrobiales bacterium]|jgi:DNA helicase-2/ATP-dependent DNA helicase PcrA
MNNQTQDTEKAFKEAYSQLNTAQKESVDTIEGPVMVIAGPGTGKTQILTLRIANILLKTDVAPESILALTFTESGAKAMRERLRRYIGSRAYQVPIYTFHGFAQKLIKDYPDAYQRVIGGRPASDLEKITLIESILEGGEVKLLRPMGAPAYYVSHILRMFGQMKQEYVTPDDFAKIISSQELELEGIEKIHEKGAHKGKIRGEYTKKEKSIEKNHELLHVYRQYEALLTDKKLYDFEDMIVETVKALSSQEDMLRDLQEQYQYVLADEHQDVNGSQNKILELLAAYHDSPNIFVVGDEKQAIYRFQGASLENFRYFDDIFKGTKTISLTKNYRSGQMILDAAHSLVEVEDGPLKIFRVPLSSEAVPTSEVTQRCFSHQAVEDVWVVDEIKAEIQKGVSPEEITIIVRTNREVESFAGALRKQGVAVTASADGDILKHPMTHAVQGLINAVIADKDEGALFAVLHGTYWGMSINDLVKIASARSYGTTLVSILSDKEKLEELKVSNVDAAYRVFEVIQEARKKEVHEAPHRVLEYLLQESGFLNHLLAEDMFEGARVVRRLYDEVEELVLRDGVGTLREVSQMFAIREEYRLPLNAPYIATDPHAVQVMTAHKSKGLEFGSVFIPHLHDNAWGNPKNRKNYFDIPLVQTVDIDSSEVTEDDRRLLYVAMTRAKTALHMSCADTNADGKELIPTRLFDDMDSEYLLPKETNTEDAAFDPMASLLKKTGETAIDAQLITTLLEERGFSATSLNNYLRSPWDYFYRNVLRIPETQAVHMQFGTAVHNVMEKSTKRHTNTGAFPSDTEIKQMIEMELNKLPVTKEEYVRLLEKGLEALYPYLAHTKVTLPKVTREELSIRVVLPTGIPELPELTLTGKLDRLDIAEDGIAYRVVDYKTGKPKTRNVIEGNTASSDGGYKRQLVFYTLLLSLYGDDRYKCNTGVLSFIEPDAKGVIHEEVFTVTQEEVSELKEAIITAVKSIISGKFLQQPCEEGESEYCHLVKLLQR